MPHFRLGNRLICIASEGHSHNLKISSNDSGVLQPIKQTTRTMEMVLCGSDFEVPLNEQRDIKSGVEFGDVIIFRTMVSLMTSQL